MDKDNEYYSLPKEVRMQFFKECISELYPFTEVDIEFYKEKLDFSLLSHNSHVIWSYPLLNIYKDKWDWNSIENNDVITNEFNLALLFPDRVSYQFPKCNCHRKLSFCDKIDYYCYPIYEKPLAITTRKAIMNVHIYRLIELLISKGIIEETIIYNIFFQNADFIFGDEKDDDEIAF